MLVSMPPREDLDRFAFPVGLAAGLVMLASAWLPWTVVHYRTQVVSLAVKATGFSSWHGKLTAIAGLAVAAAALIRRSATSAERRKTAAGVTIACGLVALGACIHQALRIGPTGVTQAVLHTSSALGFGLYLSMAAAIGALAAGFLGARDAGPEDEPQAASERSVGATAA
jgi:hypothetical protein